MSSTLDPAKLKVADLRNELSNRGLDVKGTKPVLVKRLKDALEKELEKEIPDTSIVDTSTEEAEELSTPRKSLRGSIDEKEEVRPSRSAPTVTPSSPEKPKPVVKTPEKPPQEKNVKPAVSAPEVKSPVKVPEQPKPVVKTPEQPKPAVKAPEQPKPGVKTEQSKPVVKTPEKPKTPKVEVKSPVRPQTQTKSPEKPKGSEGIEKVEGDSTAKKVKLEQENGEQETKMEVQEESEKPDGEEGKPEDGEKDGDQKGEKRKRSSDSPERSHKRAKSPVKEDEPEINADAVTLSWYDSDLHLQVDKTTFLSARPLRDGAFGYVWAGARATHGVSTGKVCYELKVTEKLKWEEYQPRPDRDNRYRTDHRQGRRDDRRKHRNSESAKSDSSEKPKESSETNEDAEKKDESAENKDDAKVPENDDIKSETADKAEETAAKADEPMDTAEVDEKKVEENGEKKDDDKDKKEDDKDDKNKKEDDKDDKNKKEDGKDRKDDDDDDKKEKVEEEPPLPAHFIRIGWSVASASLQLGEDKHSYCYESSGKAVKEKEFSDYGVTFDAGDVVGAFLDISATTVILKFTVNGQVQPSLEIPKTDLPEDFVLYPHVLTRNYTFELNFGEKEEPWFPVPSELAGHEFIGKSENKVAGLVRPEARSDCEVLLMCGLPASGKTKWVTEHISSNPEKRYTVLGIHGLFDRMTVGGEPLKSKYKGRWSNLVDKLAKSLNRLVSMAALRRRNYIIDQQTNVFPSAQRRKMRPFEGFKRKAVIVVNGDEEQARRQALQESVEGKEVPDSTLLEMKAAMVLPEVCDWLEEIVYVGSTEEEAKEIIKKYNAVGKAAGYGSERRFNKDRWNYNRRNDYRGGRNFQRQGGGGGGYNRQPYPQSRWGGAPRQGGGGSGGGWKQDSRSRDWRSGGSSGGGYERRDRDYYSQGSYGGGRSQQPSGGRPQGGGQRWGGQSSGGGWSGQGGGGSWNQQTFGGGGGRSYGQGWGGQGGQGGWGGKYGSSGSGGGGQGGQGYGGYNNWNYYGQQQQNWSGQK